MKTLTWIACAGMTAGLCSVTAAPGERPKPDASGVPWETSFASAKARAKREGKPILVLHLFGKLDDALC